MEAGAGPLTASEESTFEPIDPAEAARIAAAREVVQGRIERACARSGRDAAGIQLIAVSKTIAAERLRAAHSIGIATFGENRVQEAVDKVHAVPGASWHLVGPLQSNKARRAVETFACIQTVDSLGLASRLDRIAGEIRPGSRFPVLLQVNVDEDPAKAGFEVGAIGAAVAAILDLRNLEVRGLMTVGRLHRDAADARSTFVRLRRLSEDLRDARPALGPELSMGMSDDFEVAVEEGATMVRIGRLLFGARSPGAG